eukprot:g955.t1
MTVNDVCDVEHPNLKSLQDIIEAAEDMENPKAALILAIFASKNEDAPVSEPEVRAEYAREDPRAPRQKEDASQDPGPHQLGPGAFGLAWWHLGIKAVTALPLAQRPVPSSERRPPEISFEDAGQMPQHFQRSISRARRIKLAAKALQSLADPQDEVPLSQALQLVHWAWAHQHPYTASSSLVPMLFLGNESSAVLHWALMLLATQLWRKVTSGQRREYLVDNRFLKAKTTGLSYFFSRRFDDVDPGKTAVWGQVVVGRKRGNWVKVGHCCYLPTELDGIQVLRDDFGPEDIAQTPLSPRALGRPADIPSYAPGYALEHRSEERRSPEDLEGSPTLTVDLAKDLKKALSTAEESLRRVATALERLALNQASQARTPELTSYRLQTPSSAARGLQRCSSAGRLTPLPSRVPKGNSSLSFREDFCVMGTPADALAFLNAGCRPPKTPKPAYLPQLDPPRGPQLQPELEKEDNGPRDSGHVVFCPTPMNTVHVITPYSKVYGKHPSLFNYDRKGEMQLNDKGERATLEAGLLSSSTAILTDRTAPQDSDSRERKEKSADTKKDKKVKKEKDRSADKKDKKEHREKKDRKESKEARTKSSPGRDEKKEKKEKKGRDEEARPSGKEKKEIPKPAAKKSKPAPPGPDPPDDDDDDDDDDDGDGGGDGYEYFSEYSYEEGEESEEEEQFEADPPWSLPCTPMTAGGLDSAAATARSPIFWSVKEEPDWGDDEEGIPEEDEAEETLYEDDDWDEADEEDLEQEAWNQGYYSGFCF